MGQEVLKKFDRYFLLDSIAQGGMAEIYRARPARVEGGSRLLVIKRILAGYGKNKDFLKMFRSEINVMLGFNHPNIVQLYDFGEDRGQPFIAMEFVDGKNLRQYITRYARRGQSLPIELACYIVEQVASGLHYAHTFKDKITGEALNLVHRDISPQNVLVSFEGNVKIIDFGIAKASTNVEATRVGIIKGKPSYLSPEQISGEILDGRSDIFSLGTVLWESLTGKKLFAAAQGESEFAVLKLIESCDTYVKPPSKINPSIPKELDDIVMRALAKKRERRFQTAEELQRTLNRFLRDFVPDFSPSDLAHAAKALFKEEIVEDRKLLQQLSLKAAQALESGEGEIAFEGSEDVDERKGPDTLATFVDSQQAANQPGVLLPKDLAGEGPKGLAVEMETGHRPRPDFPNKVSSPSPSHMPAGNGIPELDDEERGVEGSNPKALRPGARTTVKKSSGRRNITDSPGIGTRPQRSRRADSSYGSLGSVHRPRSGGNGGLVRAAAILLVASAVGFMFSDELCRFGVQLPGTRCKVASHTGGNTTKDPSQPKDPGDTPEPRSDTVVLKINAYPGLWNARVTVNGTMLDPQNPLVKVSYNQPLVLQVDQPNYKPFVREFSVTEAQVRGQEIYQVDVELEPDRFGFLSVRSTPSADATIVPIDGRGPATNSRPWVVKTPFDQVKLPIGTYRIELRNDVLGMGKTITVDIREGRNIKRVEELKLSP